MEALALLSVPMLAGFSASLLLEQLLSPKPLACWRRPFPAMLLHLGTWLLLFAILLSIALRPWFAVIILLAFQLLLLLVNHAKYDSLREPFIFQDFEYFTDAVKHPRLYLPFFGITRTLAATIGFVGALITGILLEPPLTETLTLAHAVLLVLTVLSTGLLLIRKGLKHCPAITCEPAADLCRLGQIAFFWAYQQAEKHTAINSAGSPFNEAPADSDKTNNPHIVVVQSESFFDPRSLNDHINTSVLEHFDQAISEACHHGRVRVPAWGANTVRTECGFLTALSPEQLGAHRFNPYRSLAKKSIPNLAAYLKQAGYQTACIHPYPVGFYLRDQVFPRMGFDRFIDIASFDAAQKDGQYIGDLAVTDKVCELLESSNEKPWFIFVITMENHGPLHLEQPGTTDNENFYRQTPPPGCEDLTVYLRHLKNADLMIKRLKDCLLAKERAGMLCWYGDHVPIMTQVYKTFGEPDGLTDYFIWRTADKTIAESAKEISIDALSRLILKTF